MGQSLTLVFVVVNPGPDTLDLLVWGTPFESRWFAPFVSVTRDGVLLPYGGAQVKRAPPTPAQYLRLGSGQSHEARIDLDPVFDLSQPGHYRVLPQITLHDVVVGGVSGDARALAQFRPQPLPCPARSFELTR